MFVTTMIYGCVKSKLLGLKLVGHGSLSKHVGTLSALVRMRSIIWSTSTGLRPP